MFQDGNLLLDEIVNNVLQILETVEKDGFHLNYTNDSSCLLLSFYRNAMRAKASCLLGETSEFWGGYPWNKEKGTYKCVPLQKPLFSSLTYTTVICYNTETTTSDLDPVDVSHHRLLGSFCHPSVLDPISIRVSVWTSEPPSSHPSPFLSTLHHLSPEHLLHADWDFPTLLASVSSRQRIVTDTVW